MLFSFFLLSPPRYWLIFFLHLCHMLFSPTPTFPSLFFYTSLTPTDQSALVSPPDCPQLPHSFFISCYESERERERETTVQFFLTHKNPGRSKDTSDWGLWKETRRRCSAMQTTVPELIMFGSQVDRSGFHTVRQTTWLESAKDRRLGGSGGLVCCASLAYPWGWGNIKPPTDRARSWTIHQRVNQTDLEHIGTCASDTSMKATASAATDWPDLSYSSSALIRTHSIREILTRMISLPPCWDLGQPEQQA